MLRILVSTALISVICFSCERNSGILSTTDFEAPVIIHKWEAAANSENPYELDSMGIIHNLGLDYLIARVDAFTSSNAWFDSVPYLIYDFLSVPDNLDESYWDLMGDIWPDDLASMDLSRASTDSMLEQFSSAQDVYYLELLDSVGASISPADLHEKMIGWEGNVNASVSLNSWEKEVFLSCASVARYSAYYWYEELLENPGNWFIVVNKFQERNWEDTIVIFIVDVIYATGEYEASGNKLLALAAGLAGSAQAALDEVQD